MTNPAADAAYLSVVKAAQKLLTDDTKNHWPLADSVLAYAPGVGRGGNTPIEGGISQTVPERLKALAALLTDDGVHTPAGSNYTPKSLEHLRDAAVAWPLSKRYSEAAYRTHQEAGSPTTDGGRVLAALVGIARGENKHMPVLDDPLDSEKWTKAVYRVQTRRKGFGVAANDLRTALGRRTNLPGRNITRDQLQDQIDSGEIETEDVAATLPTDALVGEVMGRTEEAWKKTLAESSEGMTDEEIAEADALVGQLETAIDALSGAADSMGEGYSFVADLTKAEGCLVRVLRNVRRNKAGTGDAVLIRERIGRIRNLFDLIEMGLDGDNITSEIEKYLQEQAS